MGADIRTVLSVTALSNLIVIAPYAKNEPNISQLRPTTTRDDSDEPERYMKPIIKNSGSAKNAIISITNLFVPNASRRLNLSHPNKTTVTGAQILVAFSFRILVFR